MGDKGTKRRVGLDVTKGTVYRPLQIFSSQCRFVDEEVGSVGLRRPFTTSDPRLKNPQYPVSTSGTQELCPQDLRSRAFVPLKCNDLLRRRDPWEAVILGGRVDE